MNWKPIETAPTDRRILLYYPQFIFTGVHVICGKYDYDIYARDPKPYWEHDLYKLSGKLSTKSNQPTMWAEIPEHTMETMEKILILANGKK